MITLCCIIFPIGVIGVPVFTVAVTIAVSSILSSDVSFLFDMVIPVVVYLGDGDVETGMNE